MSAMHDHAVPCECESCRIDRDAEMLGYTADDRQAMSDLYWSLFCARCGQPVKFGGLMPGGCLCRPCGDLLDVEDERDRLKEAFDDLYGTHRAVRNDLERVRSFRVWLGYKVKGTVS